MSMKFKPVWVFHDDVEEFFAQQCEGFTIHVCNGESQLGDVRIDRYTDTTDIKADFRYLPIKPDVADTVLCDPPWELSYPERYPLLYELVRILKFGGKLVMIAPWYPDSPYLECVGCWLNELSWKLQNRSLISVMRKIQCDMFSDSGRREIRND